MLSWLSYYVFFISSKHDSIFYQYMGKSIGLLAKARIPSHGDGDEDDQARVPSKQRVPSKSPRGGASGVISREASRELRPTRSGGLGQQLSREPSRPKSPTGTLTSYAEWPTACQRIRNHHKVITLLRKIRTW